MPSVTIALAAAPIGEGRHLVVAWLAALDRDGQERTRGLAEIWVGPRREGLARIAIEALDALDRPSEVRLLTPEPAPGEPPPCAETIGSYARAAARHKVRAGRATSEDEERLRAAAERFAAARAAGVGPGPVSDGATRLPPVPRRLF